MTQAFSIRCKTCGNGWVLIDSNYEDTPDAVLVFPRLLCLTCGASEDVRSNITRTEPDLVAEVTP